MRRSFRAAARAAVLAVALTTAHALPAVAAAPPAGPPPTPVAKGFVPGTSVEDVSRRTQTSKTFANPDGTFTTRFATGTIHAKDHGRWVDVVTDIETGGDGRHHAKKLPFGLEFADGNTGEISTVDLDGAELGFTLVGARKGDKPKVNKNTIRYANVFPDVDLHVRVHGDGYKENFELAKPSAQSDFTYAVRSPADVTFTKDKTGGISIERAGEQLALIPPPFMAESEDGEALPTRSSDVEYTLSGAPGSYRIGVHADRAWLEAPERKYPVVIDPTLLKSGGAANDESTCSATALANTYYSDIGLGYESATPLGWCKGWLRFDLTSLTNTTVTDANLELTLWHSYANHSSLTYVDRIDPLPNDWAPYVVENDMSYRGGTYYPVRSYRSFIAGENTLVGRYTVDITQWGKEKKGRWGTLMLESGVNNYTGFASTAGTGDSTINEHTYKIFRSAEYGTAADRPEAVVTWTNATPSVPTTLSPADDYVGQAHPTTFSANFSDTDGGTGHAEFEVWNSSLTTRVYTMTGSTVSSGGTSSYSPTSTWGDGKYKWRAAADDTRAQSGWSAWRDMTVDNGDPAQPANPSWSAGAATTSTTLTAQWTPGADAVSGVTNHYLRVSTQADDPSTTTDEFANTSVWTGYTGSAAGSYTLTSANGITAGRTYFFKVTSKDLAGNIGPYSTTSAGITVDQVAPGAPATLTSTSHPANVPAPDPTIDVLWSAATDTGGSFVNGYEVGFDHTQTAGTTTPRTAYGKDTRQASSSPLADGTWYAHVRAYDLAGNRGPDATYGPMIVDTISPDTPTVSCPTHPYGVWTPSRHLVCSFTSADGTTTAYSVVLDQSAGTVPPATANNTGPAYATDVAADAAYWLHVRGTDLAGNWSNTSVPYDVRIDATKPAPPTVTSPTHGVASRWYNHNDPRFDWTATDTAPITGYSWVVDQDPGTEAPFTETTTTTTTRTDAADGVWYVHVRARNAAGLWSDTATRAARVDTTVPVAATATSPTHPDTDPTSLRDVRMTWGATPGSDVPSGIAGYSYAFTADPSAPIDATTETIGTEATASLADGTWYFHLRTVDNAGNSAESVYGPIRVDAAGPPISTTEKNRFVDLWLPRAQSEEFYQDYFAADGYPQYILDEGFHGLPSATKHYLTDQLWVAFTAAGTSDVSLDDAGRQVMYEFVFDKQKQADPADPSGWDDPGSTFTPGPDKTKPRPARIANALAQSEVVYDTVAAAVDAIVPVDPATLPVDVDDLPDVVEETVTSALSADALAEVARLAAAGDPVGEVLARLAKVDDDLGVTIDSRAVFALPDRLPLNYTACWDTASYDNCKDATAVGTPVDVDLTGDGTNDATVTFGPGGGTTPADAVNLQLDVKRYVPLPGLPGLPPPAQSDLAGQPMEAHVWVVYDLGLAGTPSPGRLQFGFDGHVHGERLAEETKLTFTPDDLLSAAQRDFSGNFGLTHTWPDSGRPQWALTVGRRALEGDPDPLDAVLTFENAQNASGHVTIRNDDGVNPIDRTTNLRFDTAVTSKLTANIRETISTANETTNATIVLTSIPAGTDFTAVRRRQPGTTAPGADETTFAVDNNADPDAVLPRVAGLATVVNDRGQDHITFDMRDIAHDTTVTGIRTAASSFDYTYTSGDESGSFAASLRTKDTNGALTLFMQAAASSLPTSVHATYGPSEVDDRTAFAISSGTRVHDLSFTGYDRGLGLTMDADLTDLPTYVQGEVSPGASYLSVIAGYDDEDGVGFASGVLSSSGGRVSRRTGEHATLIRKNGAVGASFRAHGVRSGTISLAGTRLGGEFSLDPGSYDTTHPFTIALDVDGLQASAALTNLPDAAEAWVDLGTPIAFSAKASTPVTRAVFYGRDPDGRLADGAIADIPAELSLAGTLSANGGTLDYSAATAGADIERSMFSTDLDPGDASGLTVRLAATDLPARMTAAADRDARTAEYHGYTATGQPAGIGHVDARMTYQGGKARVPAGQHATFSGSLSSWGASARVDDLVTVKADANASYDVGHALVVLAQPGGPFTADVALDDLRGYVHTSDLPASMEAWADVPNKTGHYVASGGVDTITVYGTKVGTGPTVSGTIEGAPSSASVVVKPVGAAWNVEFTSSAPIHRGTGFFSEQYVPQGIRSTTDYISVDVAGEQAADGTWSKMPKDVNATFDLGARKVQWRSPTTIGSVKLRGRGPLLYGWIVSAAAEDVPAEFDAAFGVDTKLFDGRGGSVGHLDIQAGNHGSLIRGRSGNHLVGRFDLSDGNVDVTADISDVSFAKFVTGVRSMGIEGSATNDGRPLQADVTVDDLVAADGANEFTVRIAGRVDKLPSRAVVTAKTGSLDYDSVGHLGGQLQVFAGWAGAIDGAEAPQGITNGISVTDGACDEDECDPKLADGSQRFMCSIGKDTCYAARAVITHPDVPTHLSAELRDGLTVPLVSASGLAAGSLRVRADLRHIIDEHLVVDLTQEGIDDGAALTVGPITVTKADEGTLVDAKAGITPRAGVLEGTVSLPDSTFGFGGTEQQPLYEITAPEAFLQVSDLPPSLTLSARWGRTPRVEVNTGAAIARIEAKFNAGLRQRDGNGNMVAVENPDNPECYLRQKFCGRVELEDLPAAPDTPISVQTYAPRSDRDDQRVFAAPSITFSAPEEGVDLTVNVDRGLMALAKGELDVFFDTTGEAQVKMEKVTAFADNLSTLLYVSASVDRRTVSVWSPTDSGSLYVEAAGFEVDASGRFKNGIPLPGGGPLAQARVSLGGTVKLRGERTHMMLLGFRDATLLMDSNHLGFGLTGDYFWYELGVEGFEAELSRPTVALGIRIMPILPWNKDFFAPSVPICSICGDAALTLHNFTPIVMNADEYGSLNFTGQYGGVGIPGMDIELRPSPHVLPYDQQGLVEIEGDGKRKLFTILPAATNTLAVQAWATLIAAVYNPFDNTAMRVNLG